MRYPKLRELKEAIRALIKGPYTQRFPYVAHKPFDSFRGKPEFHEEDCVGCGACAQVCPARAIEMKDEGDVRTLTVNWGLCIFCGQCQANCLTGKGIVLSQEFDLAVVGSRQELSQKIEKKLLLCSCCGEAVATFEHILWVSKKLGPLTFANASLMLFYLGDLGLAQYKEGPPGSEAEFSRPDRIRVLCPRCRREAVLKS
ncbi:MAG: 4Fe-4S binding protein [Candidatus Omnitrophica bacterium]|nr:4Fe-4S binding protein [Candidatus Omnitrophota bacterium]